MITLNLGKYEGKYVGMYCTIFCIFISLKSLSKKIKNHRKYIIKIMSTLCNTISSFRKYFSLWEQIPLKCINLLTGF